MSTTLLTTLFQEVSLLAQSLAVLCECMQACWVLYRRPNRCKRDLGTPAIWGPRPKNASDVRTPLDPISLAVQGSRQRRGDPLMRAGWTMTAIDESVLDDDSN